MLKLLILALTLSAAVGCSEMASIPEGEFSLFNYCDPLSGDISQSGFNGEADLRLYLAANHVEVVNAVPLGEVVQFARELKRMPEVFNKFLAEDTTGIRLIGGQSVVDDPTFYPGSTKADDGRLWSDIGGVGTSPTRIVASRLYRKHGTINLVLHERAHTLDIHGLRDRRTISRSDEWTAIMQEETEFIKLQQRTCGDYCTKNHYESFAEAFAIYYSCQKGRKLLDTSPRVVKFMQNLENFDFSAEQQAAKGKTP